MKKITGIVAVIAAFALTMCLAACSSDESSNTDNNNTLDLDKTVSFHGITLNVSSEWEEDIPQEFDDDGIIEYTTYPNEGDSINVQVQYFLWNLGASPSDLFQSVKEYFSEDYPDFDGNPVDTRTVASSECNIYNISYTGDSDNEISEQLAYIMSENCNYAIAVGGTCDHTEVMNAILDTVSIES